MRKFSLFSSVLVAGLLLVSCAADVDLEEVAEVVKPQGMEKANMHYTNESTSWLPPKLLPNFIWGIGGHPVTQHAYGHNEASSQLATQINYIKELKLDYYRVDVELNASGQFLTSTKACRFNTLASQYSASTLSSYKGFKVLPVILLTGLDYSDPNLTTAFNKGREVGKGFAYTYGQQIDVYEVGNEQEIQNGLILPGQEGSATSHYDIAKVDILAAYLRGMIEGIRLYDISNDNSTKIIINYAGWVKHHYFKLLIDRGVYFEIIGLHHYSDIGKLKDLYNNDPVGGHRGNVLSMLATYGKKIWITEINRRYGNKPTNESSFPENSNKDIAQGEWIQNYVKELHLDGLVEAYFVHDLYDQDYLLYDTMIVNGNTVPNSGNDGDATFGILKTATYDNYTAFQKKAAFNTYKFIVEENKYGYEDYIYSLFKILNKMQTPSPEDNSDIITWSNTLGNNRNKLLTVSEIMKQKYYAFFVKDLFQTLLGRINTNQSVEDFFVNRLKNGATREEIITDFCHGDEFWQLSGSNNTGFINRLFNTMIGRLPTTLEQTTWLNKFNTKSKGDIIRDMFIYQPYVDKFVNDQYLLLHNRPVSSQSERLHWRNQIQGGLKQNDFIRDILAQNECWEKAIMDGYNRRYSGTFGFVRLN